MLLRHTSGCLVRWRPKGSSGTKSLLLVPKLANITERISFLVECRKAQVFTKFIQDIITGTSAISTRGNSFEAKKRRFCRDMLNEAIKESYRKRAYLLREKRRLEEDNSSERSRLWPWLQDQCRLILGECREANRRKLGNKFARLTSSPGSNNRSLVPNRRQEENRRNRPGPPRQMVQNLRDQVAQEEVPPQSETEDTAHDRADESTGSFKNLSNLQLEAHLSDLLNRGPKFALTREGHRQRPENGRIWHGARSLRPALESTHRKQTCLTDTATAATTAATLT